MIETLYECPHCKQQTFDVKLQRCRACGTLATEDTTTVNEQVLASLLINVQIRLFDMPPHEFQQMLGVFSERLGHPETDGIPFTDESCEMTLNYLKAHGIICVRLDEIGNGERLISLAISSSMQGIERFLKRARKVSRRDRTRVVISWGDDVTTETAPS